MSNNEYFINHFKPALKLFFDNSEFKKFLHLFAYDMNTIFTYSPNVALYTYKKNSQNIKNHKMGTNSLNNYQNYETIKEIENSKKLSYNNVFNSEIDLILKMKIMIKIIKIMLLIM